MIPRNPLPFEGGPEDPDTEGRHGGEEPDGPGWELHATDDAARGGWVPPDARHWRHPSEMHGSSGAWSGGTPALGPGRRRPVVGTALVASSAAAAVVAGLLLLVGAGSTPTSGDRRSGPTPTLTEAIGCCRYVPTTARATLEGMVSLRVTTAHGHRDVCGVAVSSDGLIVTTLDALTGARSITAVTASGRRERALMVAGDPGSDVALVRVDSRLSTAPFTERPSTAGQAAMVVAMDPPSPSRSATMLWAGSVVRSAGAEITRGQAAGLDGIDTAAPAMPSVAGEALVAPDGRVVGVLDRAASSPSVKVFLPTALVLGVARALSQSGKVRHGWLGVVGENVGGGPVPPTAHHPEVSTTTAAVRPDAGVLVAKVEPDGPAAAVLRPDDVITSVDGARLQSMAELRSLLYVMRPGERVRLGIVRGGTALSVALHLSASP